MYEWLTFALMFVALWGVFYIERPALRREMLWVSLFTSLAGFSEPIFVPAYWNPPSLFNLAATTHFDIESIIFCFAIGGIGSVIYESRRLTWHRKIKNAY